MAAPESEHASNHMVCVDPEVFNSVVDYLLDRPAREVHKLLCDLQTVTMVDFDLYTRVVDTSNEELDDE